MGTPRLQVVYVVNPQDVNRELHDLCARRDIYSVICQYMRGQDRLMPELQRSAFHDDAYVDCGVFAGSADSFVRFAQGVLASLKSTQHLIGQVHIRVEGNVAFGEVYFIAFHRIVENETEKDLFVAGRYIDQYEDRGHGWKIAKRRELIDWVRTDLASDSSLKEQAGLVLGARGADDFSNQLDWPDSRAQE
jgi:SnoaL-like domain